MPSSLTTTVPGRWNEPRAGVTAHYWKNLDRCPDSSHTPVPQGSSVGVCVQCVMHTRRILVSSPRATLRGSPSASRQAAHAQDGRERNAPGQHLSNRPSREGALTLV